MPFGSIQLNPGVNTVATPTLNQAGISKSNLIRFRMGLVEKLGGWLRFFVNPLNSITRALHAWEDLSNNSWLAAGNLASLDVIVNSALTDITPQIYTSNTTPQVTTVIGSYNVTINDPNVNTLTINDAVFFNTPITVGGVILSAGAQIIGAPTATTYIVAALTPATSSVVNGGTVPVFTTVAGSSSVNVLFTNHGLSTGGKFVFSIPTLVGGLTISGVYTNITVVDANNFTIAASQQATFSATVTMNSGNAQYVYSLGLGPALTSRSGAMGPIGQFAIGQGYLQTTTSTAQTGTPITTTDWSLDNWGEILLACPRGGAIWWWLPGSGQVTAYPVGSGPFFNNGIFVAMPAQILVAWGSTSSIASGNTDAAQDQLIVRWSDQLNFDTWQVTATNQAGSFHIPTGSTIRGGIQGSNIALIFTDVDVWSMTYIGYPLVFGFNKIYSSGGLVGAHALCEMRGAIYWMSYDNFYVCMNGAVNVMPCTIWDNVFQDFDTANQSKVVAGAHTDFDEVIFFFPSVSGGTGENDKYAKYNVVLNTWDYGAMPRSAWQARSVLGYPIGSDPTTLLLQQHEMGYSADGAAMDSYIESGYFAYGDGENFAVIDHFEPDMKYTTFNSSTPLATPTVTLTAVNYPSDVTSMTSVTTMTSTTEYLTPRVRGRQAKWRIETNDATSWWRMGNIRYRFNVDGRR